MTYVLYGATLSLAWFLIVNLVLSILVTAVAGAAVASVGRSASPPEARASRLLTLRLLPAAASMLFVAAVFVPSYVLLEPRDFDESFGVVTVTCAAMSCLLLAWAAGRGATAWREAAHARRAFFERARPMARHGVGIPLYCADVDGPPMTLVGVWRPALLVAERLVAVLTPEELDAAVRHELSHLRSWDNLKRLVIRAAPDVMSWTRVSRRLEQAWALAAECSADACSTTGGQARLALAAALLKASRMTVSAPAMTMSSPLVGADAVALRIRRLMEGTDGADRQDRRRAALLGAAVLVAGAIATFGPLLGAVHEATEVLVRVLP